MRGVTDSNLLDDVNKRIIEQLQRDGRMSYAALAKAVGLSEAAVRQRSPTRSPWASPAR